MSELSHRMFETGCRVEKMIWTGGIGVDAPEDFTELIDEEFEDAINVKAAFPWIQEWLDGDADADEIAMEFSNQLSDGFIVKIAHPIPREFSADGKSYSTSWSYYTTEWFVVKNMDELCAAAEAFSAEVVERERNKKAA